MSQWSLKDRIPPYNEEAEAATLAALLLNYSGETYDTVCQYLIPEDFYKSAHQKIFRAITALNEVSMEVDLLTLINQLKVDGELERVGGAGYVSSLTSVIPTSANVEYYAKIVQDNSIRRHLLHTAEELVVAAHDDSVETRETLETAEKAIYDINDRRQHINAVDLKAIIQETVEQIAKRANDKDAYTGIPSGFFALDELTGGFQDSEMIIVGARPSIGKTAFALSMIINATVEHNIPCGFFSLEMSASMVMYRLLSLQSRIGLQKLKTGMMGNTDWTYLTEAAGKLYEAPIFIDETPGIRLLDLRAQARRWVKKNGIKIIFIDYIALINLEDKNIPRHEQIAEISRSLKALARELKIPVIVLSQVGRQTEGREPKLADLRESGSIEQDADVVLFLHRDRDYEAKEKGHDTSDMKTKVIIAKQRNGPTDTFDILFIPSTTRFENLTYQRP